MSTLTVETETGTLLVEYSDPPFGKFRKLCQAPETEQLDLAPLLIDKIGGTPLDKCPISQVIVALDAVMAALGKGSQIKES